MTRWIELEGLANLRDVGGARTVDGREVRPGRLLRSDNLQNLTPADVEQLLGLGVTDVVDLRSDYEVVQEGPGPFGPPDVKVHQHSLFREWREGVGEEKSDSAQGSNGEGRPEVFPEEALPWVDLEPTVTLDNEVAGHYVSYLLDRPDSVVAALRTVAGAPGAVLVHCAAGKDRTGTVVALALDLVGVERDAICADYAASSERVAAVVERLQSSATYADNLRGRPLESHLSHAETMRAFLTHLDTAYGGPAALLASAGWSQADTVLLRSTLLR